MAGSSLCVSCASLPIKDRDTAASVQRCPECRAEVGVTSYGARFHLRPGRRKAVLTPSLLQGLMLGAGLFTLVIVLVGLGLWAGGATPQDNGPIAANNPLRPVEQLPAHEFARVPEVALHEPFSPKNPAVAKQRQLQLIQQIKQANRAKQDGFLISQMDSRKELRGLPFIMGDACKMPQDQSTNFQASVTIVRGAMDLEVSRSGAADPHHAKFWGAYHANPNLGEKNEANIAALAQILGPEHESFRIGMVNELAASPSPAATRVLAKAAIFDRSADTRMAAVKALKNRPKSDYNAILMHGLRYPLSIVARRSAQVMIQLEHHDLLPQLVAFLGEAAPGDPAETTVNDAKVHVVRELVRVNHHRNCLLCHAPAETGQSFEVPAVMPTPGASFAPSSQEYYGERRALSEPSVRADTTYLRQDFSEIMPVANAHPWPTMQRFDFLVRTRVVEGKELAQMQSKVNDRPADYLSDNHKAAVRVLQELTGQDAAPTQAAWQRVIGTAKE